MIREFLSMSLQRASALYLLAVIFLVFSLWIPGIFLSSITVRSVASGQVTVAILALGVLIPLVSGAFDLSVGPMLAFSLVILSKLQEQTGINVIVCIFIALASCGLVGAINGFIVVKMGVNSFIATLGIGQVLLAVTLYLSHNQQIVGVFPTAFTDAGRMTIYGVPIVVVYLAVIAIVVWYFLEWTTTGRRLFATGYNPEAARLSGVRTDRLIWSSFVVSAVIAGIAGVITGAQVGSFDNSFGSPLLLPAFAAVFLGATQIKTRPNVWGTLLAVYTLAFGVEGLQLAVGAGVYWVTPLFNGVALLVAVVLAVRRSGRKLRRKEANASAAGDGASGTTAEPAEYARPPAGSALADGAALPGDGLNA
jgi:ribose transport system permease protein